MTRLTALRVVVQLAKADGLKVIASAGTPNKLEFLRSIGADVVFNYRETSVDSVLKEHGPVDMCVCSHFHIWILSSKDTGTTSEARC